MDLGLEGSRVVVTAGAAGIGLAIARAFLAEGARVAIGDVDADALDRAREDLPALVAAAVCDVADRDAVDRFVATALERLGGLDVLVNNAGIAGPTARVEAIRPEDWDRCLAVCLTGQFNLVRRAVPALRESARRAASDGTDARAGASIVNLSSVAGRLGFPLRTPYAAAKWGVIGLTKSLAAELGPDGIRVNAILPGVVAGDRIRRVLEAKAREKNVGFEAIEREAFSYTSLGDYVTAEQIANQALYLAGVPGRAISAQAVSVCGDVKMLV